MGLWVEGVSEASSAGGGEGGGKVDLVAKEVRLALWKVYEKGGLGLEAEAMLWEGLRCTGG